MNPMQSTLEAAILSLAEKLRQSQRKIATAESCTGGMVAQYFTALAGSSDWFERGFVTYSNEAKQECLGVAKSVIESDGAVSEACALAMAQGCLAHSHADYALSITGIAGPGGGSEAKPVGTVCFGFAGPDEHHFVRREVFAGDREAIRQQSALFAIRTLLEGFF